MSPRTTCPHCRVSLKGDTIPEDVQAFYGGATHLDRSILVEIRGVYDGGLFYRCPDCGGAWHRFRAGNPLHTLAAPYVDGAR